MMSGWSLFVVLARCICSVDIFVCCKQGVCDGDMEMSFLRWQVEMDVQSGWESCCVGVGEEIGRRRMFVHSLVTKPHASSSTASSKHPSPMSKIEKWSHRYDLFRNVRV
jgi:hypothetical protein